ncbi:MAG: pentapeptide repeat-containing protein [Hormoscilla sp. GUM202]|nr:pentapeptide repeat-containing protein [Hormoscilla sp. GUM202]
MSTSSGQSETQADFVKGADYADRDLRGWDFAGAKLYKPNFAKADCRGANFRGAHLHFASCEGANFAGADFSEAHLSDCNFTAADLRGACFRRARIRSLILTRESPQNPDRGDSALLDLANFYECDIPFDLLRFGVLRKWQSPYGPMGVITPKMAERLARAANAATEEGSQEDDNPNLLEMEASWPLLKWTLLDTARQIEGDRELYGPYWQQKQRQVKRVVEEVGGSVEALAGREAVLRPSCWIEHPREWLGVLALPDMETLPELPGRSLLAQAINVLWERKQKQPYSPQEKARLILPRPEIDRAREFCDAANRLKELFVERWLSWLDRHLEKETLIGTILDLCDSDEDFLLMSDRTYTESVLASSCLEKGITTPKLKPFAGNRKQASKA